MHYTEMFKRKMIQKMSGPDAISASALAKEVEPAQVTLSKWLREAGIRTPYVNSDKLQGDSIMPKSPKKWSAEKKFKIVLEAASIPDDQLGAFFRSKGLHETHLQQWRMQMLDGLQNGSMPKKVAQKNGDSKKIKNLEKELKRKDKALAETAALLVLKKKVQEIWGDEDDDTPRRNGK
jgi:transposase-like protein